MIEFISETATPPDPLSARQSIGLSVLQGERSMYIHTYVKDFDIRTYSVWLQLYVPKAMEEKRWHCFHAGFKKTAGS
jgi:hypothetical protein